MTIWLVAATVATLWTLLALTWLAVLVPLAGRDPTDDPRGEAPATDTRHTND
jgi:hypothetical protein